jgi:hypothetical protein
MAVVREELAVAMDEADRRAAEGIEIVADHAD